jgi:hypothetical protein
MAISSDLLPQQTSTAQLSQAAVFPRTRVLAWDGKVLYAARGYQLLRAHVDGTSVQWQAVARYRPPWWRNLTAASTLSFRLCRDGFHALAILPSKYLVAAVPGAIITLIPEEAEFRVTHAITRGTRPLHIAATPSGRLYWGEYFDNPHREEVHVYASDDQGLSWHVVHTFAQGAIRHIHNIVYDEWENCLWVLTGDNSSECRVLKVSENFTSVETVLSGNQQARSVALVTTENGTYFSSDTPFESNFIYCLDRRGNLSRVTMLESSSIYGCRVGNALFFSTMVEPSDVNQSMEAKLYGSVNGAAWRCHLRLKKDRWPMRLFQYGNILLPDGKNTSNILAITTIALKGADLQTTLWRPSPR